MNKHIYIIHHTIDTKYLLQLTDQLKQIKGISYWSREDLALSIPISQQIEKQYQQARIVIALLSADYFNDEEYCQIYQAKALKDGKIFIPILLRPCLYEEYEAVKELLTLPKNANGDIIALSKLDKTAAEEAWVAIAQLIKKKLNELITEPAPLPPPTIDDNGQSKSTNNMNTFSNGYALLIGVGADLAVTIKDAKDLKEILCHPQRSAYPKDHVWCLTDKNATNEGIKKAFDALKEKLEADNVNTDKTVIIYYSGHGGVDDDGTYFLCPYDYIAEGSKTRLLGSTFAQWVDELPDLGAERLLVILDCCHAGGIKDAAIKNSNEQLQKLLGQGQGKITIAACLDGEFSYI
ncbi:MAG TPA: caspase family protein, partial [Chitinophagales bacterium]|nr:caspase family protein [Chitinophagales bacterium]